MRRDVLVVLARHGVSEPAECVAALVAMGIGVGLANGMGLDEVTGCISDALPLDDEEAAAVFAPGADERNEGDEGEDFEPIERVG